MGSLSGAPECREQRQGSRRIEYLDLELDVCHVNSEYGVEGIWWYGEQLTSPSSAAAVRVDGSGGAGHLKERL